MGRLGRGGGGTRDHAWVVLQRSDNAESSAQQYVKLTPTNAFVGEIGEGGEALVDVGLLL